MRFLHRRQEDLLAPFSDFAGEHGHGCVLEVRDEPGLPTAARPLFDAGSWALYEEAGGFRYEGYAPPRHGRTPLLQADLNPDWSAGVLRLDPGLCPAEARRAPVSTPFGELLLMLLITRQGGLYAHAASVVRDGQADVLLGRSGAGKTTLSRLAADRGARILSDDRTVLRVDGGRWSAWGTPFHGAGRCWANESAPVSALLFLEHAAQTRPTRLATAEAATRLAALTFSPFWDRRGLDDVLGLCAQVAESVPSLRFGFVPDPSAVEALDEASQAHRRAGSPD